MKHIAARTAAACGIAAAAVLAAGRACADNMPVPGSAGTGEMGYATDAFPGFDPDSWKVEQKKPSWWFSVESSCKTPGEQWNFVCGLKKEGKWKKVRKACEALVREWPESAEAALAQETIANLYVTQFDDIYEAFDEYDYLLKFYPGLCRYGQIVEMQFRLAECMYEEQKAKGWMSFAWTGPDTIRKKYEKTVRYAPGAAHVPDAMMRIAALRSESGDRARAVLAYEEVRNRFAGTPQAAEAECLTVTLKLGSFYWWKVQSEMKDFHIIICHRQELYIQMKIRQIVSLNILIKKIFRIYVDLLGRRMLFSVRLRIKSN